MHNSTDRLDSELIVFEQNFEQIIYHLDHGPSTKETLEINEAEDLNGCNTCSDRSVRYTPEIYTSSGFNSDERRITRCWCDDYISQPFVDLWSTWSGTPNDELHREPN
jgi:hypothetical protein